MSHFTSVKTEIKNLIMLKQALKDLNLEYVEAEAGQHLKIKGWNKEEFECLLEIKTGGPYSVGIVQNKQTENYEFVADWWGVETYTELAQDQYMNRITQRYAYHTVMDKIKDKGYSLVNEEVDEDNNVRLVLRKWE